MGYLRLFFIHIRLLAVFFSTFFAGSVFAQGLVPECANDSCGFNDLITLIKNITNFLLILAVPVSAASFAYAGFQYIFAAGDTGKIKKAHDIFWTVFVGLVFMASAWLIVKIVVDTLDPGGRCGGGQFLGN